mgnify:FL=1
MNIKLILVGKTNNNNLEILYNDYLKRLKHYINFDVEIISDLKNTKNLSFDEIKEKEGNLILSKINAQDYVVLLDEQGKEMNSINFSENIQKKMNSGLKSLVYVVGGAYGFSLEVYNRANEKLSLSKLTFSHQMVRLFFIEQLYRAFTILKNEPYHHK